MTKHKAGPYFLDWFSKHGETADQDEIGKAFVQTCHLAEEDWKNLKSDKARLEIAVAVLDAHIVQDNAHEVPTSVLKAIRDHLLGAATGRPNGLQLPPRMPAAREPIDVVFAKVVFAMLWEKCGKGRSRGELVRDGMKRFKLTDKQVREIPSNTKKLLKNDQHASNMRTHAEEKYKEIGSTLLEDYL